MNWTQTDDEVELLLPNIPPGTTSKQIKVRFGRNSLQVSVAGTLIIDGPTGGNLLRDDSTYTLQDTTTAPSSNNNNNNKTRELCIIMGKQQPGTVW
eukprot:CAMPEP_0202456856 /NCGR_PEP_ID=MMETSP1360-20130828/14019_1 /ASSEMBLY_ACC=CAM_ASM_000848 /TAXON_ID=515479 /ORGANISM="Licmophora paradoxa, Strain CCMP2313" /LENGTH=95 /DNA_ID=CAMNT_0049076793 /DNA_START=33 /DNA_END=317 /DNA_ORIENTATION=+